MLTENCTRDISMLAFIYYCKAIYSQSSFNKQFEEIQRITKLCFVIDKRFLNNLVSEPQLLNHPNTECEKDVWRRKFCASFHSTIWWPLWPLKHAYEKFPTFKGILGTSRDWLWWANKWTCANRCTKKEDRWIETKRSQSEELPLLSLRSHSSWHNSEERYSQRHLGCHEEKIWRECKSQEVSSPRTKARIWNFGYEIQWRSNRILF